MAQKRFTAKKVGDQYVLVPQGTQQELARGVYAVGGLLAAVLGIRRGGLTGILMTLFGGGVAYRGITGRNPLAQLLCEGRGDRSGDPSQSPSHHHDWKQTAQVPRDEIDEASMESFPASDPPAPARHG